MDRKIIGIVVCLFLITTIFPIQVCANQSPKPSPPYGPSRGIVEKEYNFYSDLPINPDDDDYYIIWSWADGNITEWNGPYNPGETACASHSWKKSGEFGIRVKIKDGQSNESGWSEAWNFTVVDVTDLDVGIQMLIHGDITIYVLNSGNNPAYDLNYSIDVNIIGIVFGLDQMHKNGTKNMLPPEKFFLYVIKAGWLMGIGRIKITVYANSFNSVEATSSLKGLILLFYLKVL